MKKRSKVRLSIIFILVLAVLLGVVDFPALVDKPIESINVKWNKTIPTMKELPFHLGLDLQGGTHLVYEADTSKIEDGECYRNYLLEEGDQIDIISTKKSAYGYLSVSGGLELQKLWKSYSTNTKAKIGPNNGNKYSSDDKIFITNSDVKNFLEKRIDYKALIDNTIRVIKGTNFNYFSKQAIKNFFNKEFLVTNLADRMGIRLKGHKIENIKNTNIKSEGLVKGVIQVPADGNPIIMLSDHGTIGGYPKIANVISADLDAVGQLTPGSNINFKEVSLEEAENIFKAYSEETIKYLNESN